MDNILWGLMNIVGPLILLGLLAWVVMKARRRGGGGAGSARSDIATDSTPRTEQATHELYEDEERRRRDGAGDL